MKTFEGLAGLRAISPDAVLTIGNFDGIHRGHLHILDVAKRLRDSEIGSKVAVATFEPHPLTVLRPDQVPPRLTPPDLKRDLLAAQDVDEYVVLPPVPDVLNLAAAEFWQMLVDQVRIRHLVEGKSFTFGKGRGGDIGRLRAWSAGSRASLHVVEPVEVPLLDMQVAPVSSSLIRWPPAHWACGCGDLPRPGLRVAGQRGERE